MNNNIASLLHKHPFDLNNGVINNEKKCFLAFISAISDIEEENKPFIGDIDPLKLKNFGQKEKRIRDQLRLVSIV